MERWSVYRKLARLGTRAKFTDSLQMFQRKEKLLSLSLVTDLFTHSILFHMNLYNRRDWTMLLASWLTVRDRLDQFEQVIVNKKPYRNSWKLVFAYKFKFKSRNVKRCGNKRAGIHKRRIVVVNQRRRFTKRKRCCCQPKTRSKLSRIQNQGFTETRAKETFNIEDRVSRCDNMELRKIGERKITILDQTLLNPRSDILLHRSLTNRHKRRSKLQRKQERYILLENDPTKRTPKIGEGGGEAGTYIHRIHVSMLALRKISERIIDQNTE